MIVGIPDEPVVTMETTKENKKVTKRHLILLNINGWRFQQQLLTKSGHGEVVLFTMTETKSLIQSSHCSSCNMQIAIHARFDPCRMSFMQK